MFKEHIRSDDEVLTNSKQVLVSTDSYEALATHTKHKKMCLIYGYPRVRSLPNLPSLQLRRWLKGGCRSCCASETTGVCFCFQIRLVDHIDGDLVGLAVARPFVVE